MCRWIYPLPADLHVTVAPKSEPKNTHDAGNPCGPIVATVGKGADQQRESSSYIDEMSARA